MALRSPRTHWLQALFLLALATLLGACAEKDPGCTTSNQCSPGTSCVSGQCVPDSKPSPDAGFARPDTGHVPVVRDGGAGADGSGVDGGAVASCPNLDETETAAAPGTNDTADTAQPLAGPGTYAGELLTGEDVDFFSFEVPQAGLRMRASVGAGASGMDSAFAVYGPEGSDDFVRVGSNPMAGDVSRELFLPVAGTYLVEIYDIRFAEGAPPAVTPGTFCYQLTWAELPAPSPVPVPLPSGGTPTELSHTVSATGAIAYYQVEVAPADQVRPFVFNLSGHAAAQTAGQDARAPDVDTSLVIWDPIAEQVYAANDDLVADVNTNSNLATALTATTSSRPFWVIADHYQLGNADGAEALPAGGLQSEVTLIIDEPIAVPGSGPFSDSTRRLTADRAVQWYLGSERPGQRATVRADGSAGGLSDLLVWAEDLDWQILDQSAGGTATAAVSQVELQSDRTLFAVLAIDDLRNAAGTAVTGAYTVDFEVPGACGTVLGALRPGTGDLAINEILWDPASSAPAGDANGDGAANTQDDEFVELLNTSGTVLDLSAISVADLHGSSAGLRHVFACGSHLPAGARLLLFGGGQPTGAFGGSAALTSNLTRACSPSRAPRSLCLNNSRSEGLVLRGPPGGGMPPEAGPELARLELSSIPGVVTNADASYVRCSTTTPASAAQCDTGGTYVRHDAIPGVTTPHSPGTSVDGATATPIGERCDDAVEIAMPGVLANQTTAGFTNDYDPDASCLGYEAAGPDRVYAITVANGQHLSVTVTPDAADYDVALYLVAGTAASCEVDPLMCAVGADAQTEGGAETVEHDNTSGASQQMFIIVDGYYEDGGLYSLSTTLTP